MLELKVIGGDMVELKASGTTAQIGAEVLTVIHQLYNGLNAKDAKEEFKQNMTLLLPVCFADSKKEADELMNKLCGDAVGSSNDEQVDELLDQIDELKDLLKELKKGKSEDEAVGNKA